MSTIVSHLVKVGVVSQVTFNTHVERWLDSVFEDNGDAHIAAIVADPPKPPAEAATEKAAAAKEPKPEVWEVASDQVDWPAYLGVAIHASQPRHLFARPADGSAWTPTPPPKDTKKEEPKEPKEESKETHAKSETHAPAKK